jgi:hypothetical protein
MKDPGARGLTQELGANIKTVTLMRLNQSWLNSFESYGVPGNHQPVLLELHLPMPSSNPGVRNENKFC